MTSSSAFPFGLDSVAQTYVSSVSTSMSAYKELPGHPLCSTLDLVASTLAFEYLDSTNTKGRHKLTPPWEGPYIIAEVLKPGTYKLSNEKGKIFTNAWNMEHLRRFFP
jgi:hypothetical protein